MKNKKQKLTVFFFLLAFILVVVVGIMGFSHYDKELSHSIQKQTDIASNRRQCEMQGHTLEKASNYLSTQVCYFVVTGQEKYLSNYWDEVENARRRDKAISTLSSLSVTSGEQGTLQNAKNKSDDLILHETWAMRLVADSLGMAPDSLPGPVASLSLPSEDAALSPAEKLERATALVFGDAYANSKEQIQHDIDNFRSLLRERLDIEETTASYETQQVLCDSQFFNQCVVSLLSLLTLLFTLYLFYTLIVHPFREYAATLSRLHDGSFTPLQPSGSKRTRMFADAFNKIYEEWKQQRERLEKEQFRFRVAVQNTSVIIFEYECETDSLTFFGSLNTNDKGHTELDTEQTILAFTDKAIYDVVEENHLDRMLRLLTSDSPDEAEVLIRPHLGGTDYVWSRIRTTPIPNEQGQIVRVIGKISNIELEKAKELELQDMKSRDSLTQLYNKEAGIHLVREFMAHKSPQTICGIMLLDMDDFERINEEEGSVFADAILQEVADILRSMTGPDDIQIRLGGDEFMLFLKNCTKAQATILGPQIAGAIRELSARVGGDLQITASIGMCVTEVVDEYTGLYRCAESTLKYVKENCRGRAACYLDTSNELGTMLTQVYPEHHFINDIAVSSNYNRENLVTFALELLGRTKKLDDAIFLLLTRIGKICRVDRVSILELDREFLNFKVTYQWSGDPQYLTMGKNSYLTKEQLKLLDNGYDENGISERYLLRKPDRPCSCLHAAIHNRGMYVGALLLEVWQEGYEWPEGHAALLVELTKVIASFLLKSRADAVSEAKSEFLSLMSHEIRTPMNAISGMTEIAKASLDDPKKALDCLCKIESANTYLIELINNILDMSKMDSGKVELNLQSIELSQIIAELEGMMRPRAEEKGLLLVIQNGCSSPKRILADALRLSQVLLNIIGNAVKFTPKGGRIAVSAEPQPSPEDQLYLRFSVRDTGIGIAPDAVGRIFNAFEQAEKNVSATFGGTGLGLSISSRLVQLMGGKLEVKSTLGEGSEFFFTLPFAYACDEDSKAIAAETSDELLDLTGKRVLVAEDNDLNREIAESLLRMNGLVVETVCDGKEAVERFSSMPPGYFDAVLMDIRMPRMDGLKATRLIRTMEKPDSRTIPIIAMTANAFDEDTKKSLENGMNGHLSKPIEMNKVLETLSRCMKNSGSFKL